METVIDEFSSYFWKALSGPASMLGIGGNEWVLGVSGNGVHGVDVRWLVMEFLEWVLGWG